MLSCKIHIKSTFIHIFKSSNSQFRLSNLRKQKSLFGKKISSLLCFRIYKCEFNEKYDLAFKSLRIVKMKSKLQKSTRNARTRKVVQAAFSTRFSGRLKSS